MALFNELCFDVQKEIIMQMTSESLAGLSSTNKIYHDICNNNELWLDLLKKDYPFYTPTLKRAHDEYIHFYLYIDDFMENLKLEFAVIHDVNLIKKLIVHFIMLHEPCDGDVDMLYCNNLKEKDKIADQIAMLVDEKRINVTKKMLVTKILLKKS